MPVFVQGELLEAFFSTSMGKLGVLAEVVIVERTLCLNDPAVYSGAGERVHIGVQAVLEMARQIEALAKMEGFEYIRVEGKRHSGAKPGRRVFLERRIR